MLLSLLLFAVQFAVPVQPARAPDELELVESAPLETTLDHADLRNAGPVWLDMIGRARRSLDFAEFYLSDSAPSALTPVIEAVEAAAARGVHVRILAEEKFHATYPETLDRFSKVAGIDVRRFDVAKSYGGVLHAKYFVVDGQELYVGSQNFDWRSLEHIVELGLRVRAPRTAAAFQAMFDGDWAVAGGAQPRAAFGSIDARLAEVEVVGDTRLRCRFSPRSALPDETWWDLPLLIEWIDAAQRSVDVEVLTYKTIGRDKSYWDALESALRRAAARGVKVRLLAADWSKRRGVIEGLQSLQPLANLDVRMTTIPPFSGGHVPFARVAHAKYMLVDGERAWLGTSNWERDYFEQSRNASLFLEGGAVTGRMQRFFDELWSSTYAYDVDPSAAYEAPHVGGLTPCWPPASSWRRPRVLSRHCGTRRRRPRRGPSPPCASRMRRTVQGLRRRSCVNCCSHCDHPRSSCLSLVRTRSGPWAVAPECSASIRLECWRPRSSARSRSSPSVSSRSRS